MPKRGIESTPDVLSGQPRIAGTRISVEQILRLLAGGTSAHEIVSEYPWLKVGDIHNCLEFAAGVLARSYSRALAAG